MSFAASTLPIVALIGNGPYTNSLITSQTEAGTPLQTTPVYVDQDGNITGVESIVYNGTFQGTATLVAGTVTVASTDVTANSIILISRNTPGGTVGNLSCPSASISAGVHFVINSSSSSETSTINWSITNPGV